MYKVIIEDIDAKRSAQALADSSLQAFIDAQKHMEAEPCYIPCMLTIGDDTYKGIYWHDAFICNYRIYGLHDNLRGILSESDASTLIHSAPRSPGRVLRLKDTSCLKLTEAPSSHIVVRETLVPDDTFELGSLVIYNDESCYISGITYSIRDDSPQYLICNCKTNEYTGMLLANALTVDPYNCYFKWRYKNA